MKDFLADKLNEYRNKTKKTLKHIKRDCNISSYRLSCILSRDNHPRLEDVLTLIKGGVINLNDFLVAAEIEEKHQVRQIADLEKRNLELTKEVARLAMMIRQYEFHQNVEIYKSVKAKRDELNGNKILRRSEGLSRTIGLARSDNKAT